MSQLLAVGFFIVSEMKTRSGFLLSKNTSIEPSLAMSKLHVN